jgi:abhydrolase domain-containing protein 13
MLELLAATTMIMSSSSSGSASSSLPAFVTDTLVPLCWKGGGIAVGLAAVVAALLYAKQDSLLYFPEIGGLPRSPRQNPRGYRSPSERGVDAFEDCRIRCDDGVEIHAWLLQYTVPSGPNFSQALRPRSADHKAPTILFFHGNAGNIGFRLPNAVKMMQETKSNVLMVEYRGYGDSDTVPPTEAGLKLDAEAALNYCLEHPLIDSDRLFLFGRSLGGAVAFHLAKHAQDKGIPLSGIMVENTFTSIADMVDRLMPAVAWIKALVLRISWDSTLIVPHLSLPMLFLAGSSDELVPPSQMSRLVELAASHSESVNLHVIEGGTHNECWIQGGDPYWKSMADFVAEHAGRAHRAREEQEEKEAPAAAAKASHSSSQSIKESVSTDSTAAGAEAEVSEGSAIPIMSNRQFVNFVDLLVGRNDASAGKKSATSPTDESRKSAKKNI